MAILNIFLGKSSVNFSFEIIVDGPQKYIEDKNKCHIFFFLKQMKKFFLLFASFINLFEKIFFFFFFFCTEVFKTIYDYFEYSLLDLRNYSSFEFLFYLFILYL
jgi:hypothetical protein